jgi:hypothetical protein
MYFLYKDFIGYLPERSKELFSGSDSIATYSESLKSQVHDWEYRNKEFMYLRNSNGHRSKELSEINMDNYILCTGCSFTEGIGIPSDARYTDILASMLNTDVYNLGLGATGNDIIFYNLVTWLSVVEKKPKLIVVQWSSPIRFSVKNNKSKNTIIPKGPWHGDTARFSTMGYENNYFHTKTWSYKQLLRKMIDVPMIEILLMEDDTTGISSDQEIIIDSEYTIDTARDLMHWGIKSNFKLAENIANRVEKCKLL